MEPLSAAASVITVATVAAQVGRLHALSNEVTDIEFVLHHVAAVLEEHNCLSDSDAKSIQSLLGQADSKLHEL
jgi:hypothetical protein